VFYTQTPTISGSILTFTVTPQPGDVIQFVCPMTNTSFATYDAIFADGVTFPILYGGEETFPGYFFYLNETYLAVFTGSGLEVTAQQAADNQGNTVNTEPFVVNTFLDPAYSGLLATQMAYLNTLAVVIRDVTNSPTISSTSTAGTGVIAASGMVGGYFVDAATQTAAFTLTTDTATNIQAAVSNPVVGTSFKLRFINNDQSSTGYAGTVVGGSGVTVGTILPNPAVGQGNWEDYIFTFTAVGTTPAINGEAVGGTTMGLL
jgi:hypothetical protein